ncbi:penicillin-binding protein 2 [Aquabacterium sp. A08]|uniref:penicillin-binding protein 2 n=1 Tax=Aquabacterium sp. A08 TaxID=2718532 RepID=UPI0014211E68|nr:penicillin-binding protein 2 [Aquabacterium sp. A08]NIC42253.1 penicillin-binding protein 2 [Aquabacterium sp. A08]NIC42266.1 penicillin-binding protein 2 [Aquabacterium sp. A08]NIC42280.1 penicillin-binding protein 2 [Aquabacterium sp. A08]
MTEFKDVQRQLALFRTRVWVALAVVGVCLGLIALRSYYLQVPRHDDLSDKAERNRTAVLPIVPQRGRIVDRHGVVLADNLATFSLEIVPARTPDLDATLADLAEIVEVQPRDVRRFRRLMAESRRFDSLPLRHRLSNEEMSRVAAQLYRLPGVEIQARRLRQYPLGETGAHVIGYIGRINQREKEAMTEWPEERQANYRGTDHIGKLGVEQSHEDQLHGTTGFERVETSASGQAVRQLDVTAPLPGDTIALSIDSRLQHLVERLYGQRRGALVAINPQNGEVLAFVSMPTFNPNLFVEGIDVDNWKALNESIDRPLLNRALRGTYPPGSTYKPFMALAALETGTRQVGTVVNDPGYWVFGNHRFRSHGEKNLGGVDLRRSIIYSSNVYYYTLANDMGVDAIHDFMKPLGLGQLTGIDLQGEVRGVLPSQAWKRQTFKRPQDQRWFAGETISLGIGQGYNSFTMLQLASAMATLANQGVRHTPHLTRTTQNPAAASATQAERPDGVSLGYRPEHLQAVLSAMEAVTQEGTSTRVFAGAPYRSGGKTGTAQAVTIGQRDRYDARRLEEHQRDHSLYLAFAPVERPQVALAVVVENAGFGAAHAAPIARRVFDYLLLGRYPSEDDIRATQQGLTAAPVGTPRTLDEIPWPPEAQP